MSYKQMFANANWNMCACTIHYFYPDQGTDNMGAMFFAMHHLRMPIIVFWDLIHQSVNEVLLALQMAGLWPVVLELLLVFRLPYGPWAGQKFWRDLQDSSALAQNADLLASSHFQMWLGDHLHEETGSGHPQPGIWSRKGVRTFCMLFPLTLTRRLIL